MGVYIEGMEMPKGCYECPLMDGEYGNCKVGATGLYDPYMEDCPLTKVPEPHGRLIDADALEKDLDTIWFTDRGNCSDVYSCVADAPIVIERSK